MYTPHAAGTVFWYIPVYTLYLGAFYFVMLLIDNSSNLIFNWRVRTSITPAVVYASVYDA